MVTLTFGTKTITLRDPDFGNGEKLDFTKITRRTANGDLVVYRDSAWPSSDILNLTFSYLSQKQVQDLLSFIDVSLGQNVTYVDNEARSWIGIITTPAADVSQPAREGFSAQFSFQGVLQ